MTPQGRTRRCYGLLQGGRPVAAAVLLLGCYQTSAVHRDTDSGAVISGDTTGALDDTAVTGTDSGSEGAPVTVAAGREHTCAVRDDGAVWCWGLGYGRRPTVIAGVTGATALSSGNRGDACAVIGDGTIRCWFPDTADTPETVPGITAASAVSLGDEHGCALENGGAMKCWGRNDYGQLGDGSTTALSYNAPVSVAEEVPASALAAAYHHTCAIVTDGVVECWGNSCDEGLGDYSRDGSPTPVAVVDLSRSFTVAISAGYCHTCAVDDDGWVRCWGYVLSEPPSWWSNGGSAPSPVAGIARAVSVSTAWYHRCAVIADGSVRCSGYNEYGQLGDGTTGAPLQAVIVERLSDAAAVSVGERHSCATLESGAIACWGSNDVGQLGDDTLEESWVPVIVRP